MTSDVTVLVVEDDEALQRQLRQTLRSQYTVLTASCWTEAHEIRARADVDVMVVDVSLTSRDSAGLDALCADQRHALCVGGDAFSHDRNRRRCADIPAAPRVSRAAGRVSRAAAHVGRRDRRSPRRASTGSHAGGWPRADRNSGRVRRHARRHAADRSRGAMRHARPSRRGKWDGEGAPGSSAAQEEPARAWSVSRRELSAIPETLLESELFGHRRGAFTDARDDQRGLFQSAQRGTIMLDEIGDLAPALQGKLLRVLQEKEVHPLGAPAPVPTDVRVVTATHRDLAALVAEGRFREDLLYRINVIEVRVPPLRERPDDLAPLVRHLLDKHGTKIGKPDCTVSDEVMAVLRRHTWPGNIRELENVIERALVLGAGPLISLEDLPRHAQ